MPCRNCHPVPSNSGLTTVLPSPPGKLACLWLAAQVKLGYPRLVGSRVGGRASGSVNGVGQACWEWVQAGSVRALPLVRRRRFRVDTQGGTEAVYGRSRSHAAWLIDFLKRASEKVNSAMPMMSNARNCGQTTEKPAPRYKMACPSSTNCVVGAASIR